MSSNMRYWNKLATVPEEHLKSFRRSGGFSGTDIKPQWRIQVMTETFGPAGHGWGMTKPEFTVVSMTVHCTVGVWYLREEGGPSDIVWGVGGTALGGKTDDEAFKMSYTDALGNALVKIGVASDIYMGYFDGSKYVRKTTDEDAPSTEDGVTERKSAYASRKDGDFERIEKGLREIERRGNMEDLAAFWKANWRHITAMPEGWQEELTFIKDALKIAFEEGSSKFDRERPQ